jgi:predicted Rossmann fold nucleotide-binding protein DprA/Smf involved in DNA uptake
MKTKYIKVPISEQPTENKTYFCLVADGQALLTCHNKIFNQYKGITHYLVEVPDREQEMRELLEDVLNETRSNNELSIDTQNEINKFLNGSVQNESKQLLNKQ